MSNLDSLKLYAKKTLRISEGIIFPGSNKVQSLKKHYVELRIADSEGKAFPVQEFLKQGARLILVGDPGSGKTTSLRYFAIDKAEEFISQKSNVLPIYVPIRKFSDKVESIFDIAGIEESQIADTPLLLMLDGLDEVQQELRGKIFTLISNLSKRFPSSQIIIASRPAGLSPSPPDEFRYFHLESLNRAQSRTLISKLSDNDAQIESFENILQSSSFLEGLSQSPLLIRLLWQVYRGQGRIPTIRADLYQTACDFLLSTWDAAKGIFRRQNLLDLHSVHNILENLAFNAFSKSQHHISISDVEAVVNEYTLSTNVGNDDVRTVIKQLLSSGILIETGSGSISFIHLTFMEFYAAKRLVAHPKKLSALLVDAGPIAKETMLFAAGMVFDVAPLVEAAVERRELILAANCLREGRTENRALETYILDQLQRELGSDLIKKLAGGVLKEKRPQPESIHSKLRRQFSEIQNASLSSNVKGKRLEEFANRFFQQSFNVIDVNRNTENGEIDLILENIGTDPFWAEWGGDIFVECKNWDKSRPLKETAVFSNKVRMSRGKLGFFVSVTGFTEDALRTLKNQVADKEAPLIVPIDGKSINLMLEHREKFDLFFKEAIRKIKHMHKW